MGLFGKKYRVDDVNVRAFLALTAAGLLGSSRFWKGLQREEVDWEAVYQIAQEQKLVGLMASAFDGCEDNGLGFEIQDVFDRQQSKAFAKKVYSIEQFNLKMNKFISLVIGKLESEGLHPVLLKGQGIAQAYRFSLRRNCGDVDLLLSAEDFEAARKILVPKASRVIGDNPKDPHIAMYLSGFILELHGSLQVFISRRQDAMLDDMMERMFSDGDFRVWDNEGTAVNLPSVNLDAVYVFCHILQHLFREGVGLRQVCDLCRLLYFYRDEIDRDLLQSRILEMKLQTEWKAFAALMADWLGMPVECIPMYDAAGKYSRKARRILSYILSSGNMGKNRDVSYKKKYPYLIKKLISMRLIFGKAVRLGRIFPRSVLKVSVKGLTAGVGDLAEGR
ncbi:MAG: nucleotidyltransferase family protein [Bacteroidales bacterium]|nr:nucleotidyltransferase family protein [Bacteroidales bacterium]